eukprot:COSAG04_NODE_562_length_12576_cov_154.338703_8_plen_588_part_00
MGRTGEQNARLQALWAAVLAARPPGDIAAAAAQLGHHARQALRATPCSAGGVPLLASLLELLRAEGADEVVDAVGWELFDGLLLHLAPGEPWQPEQEPEPQPEPEPEPEPQQERAERETAALARACAQLVVRRGGSGRELRRLASSLALGPDTAPHWRQRLTALTICTRRLADGGDPESSGGEAAGWAARLRFCTVCLPLTLGLIPRAVEQFGQRTAADQASGTAEARDGGSSSGEEGQEELDLDGIEAPSAAELAAAEANERQAADGAAREGLRCCMALVEYAESELLAGWGLTAEDGCGNDGSDGGARAAVCWLVGQLAARALAAMPLAAAASATALTPGGDESAVMQEAAAVQSRLLSLLRKAPHGPRTPPPLGQSDATPPTPDAAQAMELLQGEAAAKESAGVQAWVSTLRSGDAKHPGGQEELGAEPAETALRHAALIQCACHPADPMNPQTRAPLSGRTMAVACAGPATRCRRAALPQRSDASTRSAHAKLSLPWSATARRSRTPFLARCRPEGPLRCANRGCRCCARRCHRSERTTLLGGISLRSSWRPSCNRWRRMLTLPGRLPAPQGLTEAVGCRRGC